MRFCDLVQLMHHNYEEKINAGNFVPVLIDAILDDESLEKKKEPNPMYALGKSTKEAYYSGRLPISQKRAYRSENIRGEIRRVRWYLFYGCP